MTAAELVAQLDLRGARLLLGGDRRSLVFRGPNRVVTRELRNDLRANRLDLIHYLGSRGDLFSPQTGRGRALSRAYHARLLGRAGRSRLELKGLALLPARRRRLSAAADEVSAARAVRLARRFSLEIAH